MGAESLQSREAETVGAVSASPEQTDNGISAGDLTTREPAAPRTADCPFCLGPVNPGAKKCRSCGEWVARPCTRCGTSLRGEWAGRGVCANCETKGTSLVKHKSGLVAAEPKSKSVAALTAFFLGGLGMHRFYLGDPFPGLFYLLFCWTMIPTVIGVVEGIRFAFMEDEEFHLKYSGEPLE